MFDCVNNGHYAYPVSHLLLPAFLFLLYGEGNWDSALFAFSLAGFWEVVEYIVYDLVGGYITFPDSSESIEVVCDIVLLDLGNAILGCVLSWVMIHATNSTTVRDLTRCDTFVVIIIFILYSISSSTGWYCNTWFDPDCVIGDMVAFPFGNIVCMLLLSFICYQILYKRADARTAWFTLLNVIIISGLGSLLWLSSAIMTYIAFVGLVLFYGIYYFLNGKFRRNRVIYDT